MGGFASRPCTQQDLETFFRRIANQLVNKQRLSSGQEKKQRRKPGRKPQRQDLSLYPNYWRLHAYWSNRSGIQEPERFARRSRQQYYFWCTCRKHLTLLTADAILKFYPGKTTKRGFIARDPLRCWRCTGDGSDLEELATKMLDSMPTYPGLVYMREVKVLRGKLGATDFLIVHKGCVLAVEIDGEQHLEKPYKNQPQLDAAKDEAYWNAGINLLRLHHKDMCRLKKVVHKALVLCKKPWTKFRMTSKTYGPHKKRLVTDICDRPCCMRVPKLLDLPHPKAAESAPPQAQKSI